MVNECLTKVRKAMAIQFSRSGPVFQVGGGSPLEATSGEQLSPHAFEPVAPRVAAVRDPQSWRGLVRMADPDDATSQQESGPGRPATRSSAVMRPRDEDWFRGRSRSTLPTSRRRRSGRIDWPPSPRHAAFESPVPACRVMRPHRVRARRRGGRRCKPHRCESSTPTPPAVG